VSGSQATWPPVDPSLSFNWGYYTHLKIVPTMWSRSTGLCHILTVVKTVRCVTGFWHPVQFSRSGRCGADLGSVHLELVARSGSASKAPRSARSLNRRAADATSSDRELPTQGRGRWLPAEEPGTQPGSIEPRPLCGTAMVCGGASCCQVTRAGLVGLEPGKDPLVTTSSPRYGVRDAAAAQRTRRVTGSRAADRGERTPLVRDVFSGHPRSFHASSPWVPVVRRQARGDRR
jgi:hypothetical protein